MSAARDAVLPPHQQDVKAAFVDLVRAYGGQEAASALVGGRVRQQAISDFGLRNVPAFAPLDIVIELERRTVGAPGWPHVTRALARTHDLLLVTPPRAATDAAGDLVGQLGCLAGACGRLHESAGAALADGRLHVDERRALAMMARQAMTELASLEALVAGAADDAGARR